MIQVTPQMRVLVAVEPVDFRRGIDGLARTCRAVLRADPFSGTVFVFRNRKGTAIKALVYDGQGFWLCQKRLSQGRFRWWPRHPEDRVSSVEAHDGTATRTARRGKPTRSARTRSARTKKEAAAGPERKEIRLDELQAILARARALGLSADDCAVLECTVDTLAVLTAELEMKGASIRRLRKLIFGASTETTSRVLGESTAEDDDEDDEDDESAAGMIGLLKYGCGTPFHRLERLEDALAIPMPSSTQWDIVERAAGHIEPAYDALVRAAAEGAVLHNDDTTMKILELPPLENEGGDTRTGVYTSGIVSVGEGHRIALFFTGHQHAGENLEDVLAHRAAELGPPIQMCDTLPHNTKGPTTPRAPQHQGPHNTKGKLDTIVAHCIPHARRKFVDVVDAFPDECRVVLEALRDVFGHDAEAKDQGLSPDERLYLVALQRHHERLAQDPAAWMPWNYRAALARTAPATPPAD